MPHLTTVAAGAEKARRQALSKQLSPLGRRELACSDCGYGIVLDRHPDRCPMCGGDRWEFTAWRPFARNRVQEVVPTPSRNRVTAGGRA